ncbi:hypothetical protein KUV50_06575 [Membranicola marinus]|uniref:Yip1 domain-containing protein n=1 Tax=Membranihabitans marinus TaxID=1227546 RepID=A0A953HT79_9BACT|nr:hypothetical protein [Membranihabitans marinus]MBY5957786.1 hypothetical protein [Membranihabitans marinus]
MSTISLTYNQKSTWVRSFFELNSWFMFGFVIMEYLICHYIQNELILTDQLYINTWSEQMTVDRIREVLAWQDQWKGMGYLVVIIFVFAKMFLTTICLNIGAFLMDYKIGFGQIWRIVVNATAVFAIGKLIYIGYFASIDLQTIDDVVKADLFSMLGVIGYDQVPQWAVFALGSLNLLELAYWIILSLGMMLLLKVKWPKAFGFVAMTYGVGLWIWILTGTFLMINLYGG